MLKSKFNIIILLLLTMLTLTGCYGQYKAERDFYLATREYNRFLKNIDKAQEEDYQQMIVNFRRLTINYPFLDKTAEAQLSIANLYNLQNKLDKALEEYKKVIDNYSNSDEACAKAIFTIGGIYQIKGEGEKAEEYFKKAVEEYPETKTALGIPLYLGRYYKTKEKEEESDAAYLEAISRYKSIIDEDPDGMQGVSAVDYLVSCYVDKGKWQEAVDSLSEIVDKHPQTHVGQKALFVTARIYEIHFQDNEKAEQIYRKIMDKFPNAPLAELIKKYFQSQEKNNESNFQEN